MTVLQPAAIPLPMSKSPIQGVALRKAWRAMVPPALRKYGQGAAIALAQRRVDAALAAGEPDLAPGPLIVSGFIGGSKGVSRAARLTAEGLKAGGYAPVVHDLASLFAAGDDQEARLPTTRSGGVWLAHVNAPEAIAAMSRIDAAQWKGRYRIAYWAYELTRVPAQWVRVASAFHEIWAPSRFVADALKESGIDKLVRVMPHPVLLGPPPFAHDPSTSDFVVLAMGDLKSSAARKNLIGAIDIYKRAFPDIAPSRRLILKVQSDDAHPQFRNAALAAAAGRGDILFRTGSLNDTEIGQLIAASSVLLSPHRSEGFGLTIAEAFLAGIPVLATGWSGNMDFMETTPEMQIGYTLVPVRDPVRIYRAAGLKWAEPDVDDAAAKLRALAASTQLRRTLAAKGRAAVEAQLSHWSRASLDQTALGRFVG